MGQETPKEVKPKEPDKSRFWRVVVLIARHTPLWLWRCFALGILVIVYTNVLSRGMVQLFPELGVKFSKTWPGLAYYQETKGLQLVHPLAVLFLAVVFVVWEFFLRCAFGDDKMFQRFGKPDRAKRVLLGTGVAVLAGDSLFYYAGIQSGGWQSSFSVSAVLATVVFVAVNALVVMVSLFLSPKPRPEKESK